MTERQEADISAVIDVAQQAVDPFRSGDLLIYPGIQGDPAEVIDLEEWADTPRRKRGTVHAGTVESLIKYADRHRQDGTTVWVHPTSGKIVAVIDDHIKGKGAPGWAGHRAEIQLQPTDEWLHWTSIDGQMTNQEAFANHIEQGQREIVEPPAAEMLEIAQSLHATIGGEFQSAIRISDGSVQMRYTEEVKAAAGRTGQLQIPALFTLQISPFYGEPAYSIDARLRYRVNGGKLAIGYVLDRPRVVLQECLADIHERLREQFPATFFGSPRP